MPTIDGAITFAIPLLKPITAMRFLMLENGSFNCSHLGDLGSPEWRSSCAPVFMSNMLFVKKASAILPTVSIISSAKFTEHFHTGAVGLYDTAALPHLHN
jgi:hypothetical protein